jgi:hypothetical protein
MDRRITALLLSGALLLAACGSNSDDTSSPSGGDGETLTTSGQTPEELAEDVLEEAEQQIESGAADELFANAGSGTFTVDGESFDTPVVRCEPFAAFDEPNPDDLNVRALAGSVFVEVDLSNSEGFSMTDGTTFDQQHVTVFLSRPGDGVTEQFGSGLTSGADGNWYTVEDFEQTDPMPAPFTLDGNHITGSMTVDQEWPDGATGTAEVTFDFEFPGEIQDCSL